MCGLRGPGPGEAGRGVAGGRASCQALASLCHLIFLFLGIGFVLRLFLNNQGLTSYPLSNTSGISLS